MGGPAKMVDVDRIIDELTSAKQQHPGQHSNLSEAEVRHLIVTAREIIASEPTLLHLRAPIKLVGDIHAQFFDLLRIFEFGGKPPQQAYLFLGDYVDRGPNGIDCLALLLAYKIKYPDKIFLLRGNHESSAINRLYGFHEECSQRFGVKIWKQFNDLFDHFPLAAVIDQVCFCIHGGFSPALSQLHQIASITRPCVVPDHGLLCDLLWSDPESKLSGWGDNERGVSFTFGPDKVADFLKQNDLEMMVRAHQVVEEGYEFLGNSRQLVTLFSAPNYCGEFDNAGALMSLDANLVASFQVLKPNNAKVKWSERATSPGTPPLGFVN